MANVSYFYRKLRSMIGFLRLSSFLLLFVACNEKKPSYNQPYNSSSAHPLKEEQEKDIKFIKGEEIFDEQCTACHRMEKKLVGPPLKDITKRRDKKWIFSFVSDNQSLVRKGDTIATKIWLEYNKSPMPTFKHLTKEDLEHLYYYLDQYK
ncbi:MAG: c-type cytochrome [Flavobacteriales bacterium]